MPVSLSSSIIGACFYFFSNYIVLITACNKKQKYKNTKYESLHNKKGIELKSVLCQNYIKFVILIVTSSIQRYAGVLSPYIGSTSDPSKLNFTLCTSATLISQYVHVVTGGHCWFYHIGSRPTISIQW